MSNLRNYTVGWICAISTEYVAAQAFLDERYDGPDHVSPNDNNDYTLGRIGKHDVVIAVLPDGEYGTSCAASVASDMMHSFPNIRIGLMVGIGGGVPSRDHDIRLGDVVVSIPRDGKSGVIQYNFGETIQNQSFHRTSVLDQPPAILRAAVNGLRAQYESDGHSFERDIHGIILKKPRLQKKYSRPDPINDRLYRSDVVHPVDEMNCLTSCGTDPSRLIARIERAQDEDDPVIHYGTIASGNQLMKNAFIRDKIASEEKILCFEMEAAGLMNHFPCLVIRGICDYSDSHKNKAWQGYAAMTAAAYAKDLLLRIAPNRLEAEKKISDALSGLHEVAEEQLGIAKEQLQFQKYLAEERLSEKEEACHQLFRLTTSGKDTTYEWYKGRIEERIEDTCLWFLSHENFHTWLQQDSGPLLVSADPGCGKSVLAKYLVDHVLPHTICYFFFKAQDQDTIRQALCALLHQLISQHPSLIQHAMQYYGKEGDGLINSTTSLWGILQKAVDDPHTGPVTIVLDALDECAESEFPDLIRNIESQFHRGRPGRSKLKYLLTSRPYEQILSKFHHLLSAFPYIRIPGEEKSEAISQEVNRVITYRVHKLSEEKAFSPEIRASLEETLRKTTNRTYLWVYLVFDYLEKEDLKKTSVGVSSAISMLPASVNQAYEQILDRSNVKERPTVRKALSIILGANRPLTLSEMNIAINIDYESQSLHSLDLEADRDFELRLRSWCGLFISVYCDKIYFLHQTAREFLLADLVSPVTVSSEPDLHWYHSITTCHAHGVLANVCVLYLNLFNSDASLRTLAEETPDHLATGHALLDYSAKSWADHFREADVTDDDALVPLALRIYDPNSNSYAAWFGRWKTTTFIGENITSLSLASYHGHHAVVKALLERRTDIEANDTDYSRTTLLQTTRNGHEAIVKMLEHGADVNMKDKDGWTALLCATKTGYEAIVRMLLEHGADVNIKDNDDWTALFHAAGDGDEAIVKMLLEYGADANIRNNRGWAALLCVAGDGDEAIVKMLLEHGADVNIKYNDDSTALWNAANHGDEAIVKILLEYGADANIRNNNGLTALFCAASNGDEAIVKMLLEHGADVNIKDNDDSTALWSAANDGHEAIVKMLLEYGADANIRNNNGLTALWLAADNGHQAIVRILIEHGANVNMNDKDGLTALWLAASSRHKVIVKMLLKHGADVNMKDDDGSTAPLYAADNGHKAIVKILLKHNADVNVMDNYNSTALWFAAMNGHEAIVKILLERGADVNIKDNDGLTALLLAAIDRHEAIVKILLEHSADVKIKANNGSTAFWAAAHSRHEAIVKMTLEHGVDVNIKDKDGLTALLLAAIDRHEAIVKILLERSADVNIKVNNGSMALWAAAHSRHEAIVKMMLEHGADVEAKDTYNNQTVLGWAAKHGHEGIVRLLLKHGADIEAKDAEGMTALLHASKNRNIVIVRLLLENGANAQAKDGDGVTAFLWAVCHRDDVMLKLLR